jgi:hypothetical protein
MKRDESFDMALVMPGLFFFRGFGGISSKHDMVVMLLWWKVVGLVVYVTFNNYQIVFGINPYDSTYCLGFILVEDL